MNIEKIIVIFLIMLLLASCSTTKPIAEKSINFYDNLRDELSKINYKPPSMIAQIFSIADPVVATLNAIIKTFYSKTVVDNPDINQDISSFDYYVYPIMLIDDKYGTTNLMLRGRFRFEKDRWMLIELKPYGAVPEHRNNYVPLVDDIYASPDKRLRENELIGALEVFRSGWERYVNNQRDLSLLKDSYSKNKISVRRWSRSEFGEYSPSYEIKSVDQLSERLVDIIPEGATISVQLRGTIVYDLQNEGEYKAGTSAYQVYHMFNDKGKIIYKDYGYKILSWQLEDGKWKIYRERWYPAEIQILPDFKLKQTWFLNDNEIRALKNVKTKYENR